MMELDFYPAFAQHPCKRTLFRGTFARDEIAREKSDPGVYIVNTDRRREPGQHWVLFFVSPERVVTYFDSLGSVPLHKEMYDFIGTAEHFFFSKTRLQANDTRTGGLYCLYVAARLSCGQQLSNVLKKFSSRHLLVNDRLIPCWRRRSIVCVATRVVVFPIKQSENVLSFESKKHSMKW